MMTVERFKKLFAYNNWANEKVWGYIMALTEEQFTRPCDYSIGALHDQVVHVMSVDELWLKRIRDGDMSRKLAATSEYPTRESIAEHWQAVRQAWTDYIDSLTEADLTEQVESRSLTYGKTFHNQRWEALMQVINHSTDHRAQILSLLHQVGGQSDMQDFIFFTWQDQL